MGADIPSPTSISVNSRRTPVFLVIAIASIGLDLFTPRILLLFPVMLGVVTALISLVRRERAAIFAVPVAALAFWVLYEGMSEIGAIAPTEQELNLAQITSWNWATDKDFGTKGTIKWNVEIANKSKRNVALVRVDLSTYDAAGKIVASDFTYVSAIPAGGSGTVKSYADLYGTESTARVRVSQITYSQ